LLVGIAFFSLNRNLFFFLANLARYRDEDLRVRSVNLIINNNEKQNEHLQSLQQFKNFDSENILPSPLMINNNQAYLFDNFDLIKQRYSALADFNLSQGEFSIWLN
jgi:hypothetical protein